MLKIRRTIAGPKKWVWSRDPALDTKHPDWQERWEAFARTLELAELAELPVREGLHPAIFDIVPLSRRGWLTMQAAPDGLLMCCEAVRYGLRQVHGVEIDGQEFRIRPEFDFEDDAGERRLKSEVLDRLWDPGLFAGLGSAIMLVSRLDPTSGQG